MRKPPYLNIFPDRHGKIRVYFRRGGFSRPLPTKLGSPEFNTAYSRALLESSKPRRFRVVPKGSVSEAIEMYLNSSQYKRHRESTRRTYRIELDKIRELHGARLLRDLKRKHVYRLMDDLADRPNQANKFLRFMGMICRFALTRDLLDVDPTAGIKKLKLPGDGFKDWSEKLIERYQLFWPVGTKQRLAFDLALYTGQRRSDIVKMHRNHIDDDVIRVKQHKTGVQLEILLHPELIASIAATKPTGLFLLETKYNRPYSPKGFGGSFRKWASIAGIPVGYSLHGLRKSCCRRLAEASRLQRS